MGTCAGMIPAVAPLAGLRRCVSPALPRALGAGVVLAVATVIGAALAQQPSELFGSLPEPPTEAAPAPPAVDPAGPAAAVLQQPAEAFGTLPRDARGKPDWVRALREGAIQPRADVRGASGAAPVLALDIVMKNTAQMPWVRFPHAAHTQWLACGNCHDALFAPRAGANPTTMTRILQGESCGTCHGTVAFTALYTCERCHSVAQPGQKPWW
jgi:c(7)-type cytochrome triheme protein